MAQTIATSLQKLNSALEGDKSALTGKKVTVPSTAKHSDIPNLITSIKNGSSAKITVMCGEDYEGTTLTFKNGSNIITGKVSGGKCEVSPDKEGTWTITNTVDSQQLTCYVEFNNYTLNLLAKPVLVDLSLKEFNSQIANYRGKKYNLVFCHDKAPNSGAVDVSENKDKSILMWVDGTTVKVSSQVEKYKIHFTESNLYMEFDHVDLGTFSGYVTPFGYNSWRYTGNEYEGGDYETSTENVFIGIDLGDADFSGVTSLSYLFSVCDGVETIDMSKVTGLDTGDLTGISNLFNHCYKLKTLNLPEKINTENVTSMFYAFHSVGYGLSSPLECIDLSTWKTGKVKSFYGMFANSNIKTIDITNFEATSITDTNIYQMFAYSNVRTIYCNNDWTPYGKVSTTNNVFYRADYLSGIKGTSGAYAKPKDLGGNFTRK